MTTRLPVALILVGAVLLTLAVAGPALAADPGEIADNVNTMWTKIGGTLAVIILAWIGIKVLPGKRPGEILTGIGIGLLCVSLLVSAPLWIKFLKDTANKLLSVVAARYGIAW